ncbi:6-phosphogluconolactonase [Terasakiella sp. A23]|uniref:6-phosphogluconolactonase n=1 Tax=Terasakiella sp. FCG-A23 TaxID=3080561 RepID=UPI002952A203|nr:6-phosphogluconolactonase [Terasakiella sp. A23]MDV7338533.1 6-phosphogluconolactonase [Terasakiella sp. A23]
MNAPTVEIKKFETRADWVQALADKMATQIKQKLQSDGTASIALSGGRSPAPMLDALSGHDLDWQNVTVTLVDDRWVPVGSDRSNEALVRNHLLQGPAAAAQFIGLTTDHKTPEEGLDGVERQLSTLPLPFASLFIGLGEDGHTASLFPCAPAQELAQGFAPNEEQKVAAINPESQPEARITLTLPTILNSDHIALFIYGEEKWQVFEEAMKNGPEEELPIRAVLRGAKTPIEVYWAP